VGKTGKRFDNIQTKFIDEVPEFENFETINDAYAILSDCFSAKQKFLLDIALERFFDGHTLEAIGARHNWTREYVRQCENKALKIISERGIGIRDTADKILMDLNEAD